MTRANPVRISTCLMFAGVAAMLLGFAVAFGVDAHEDNWGLGHLFRWAGGGYLALIVLAVPPALGSFVGTVGNAKAQDTLPALVGRWLVLAALAAPWLLLLAAVK